ncbi:MAG: SGNH/GDSL hydrolase family protein [Phycisphaeraceae bacterium]|nr:SGNH/GDSL hydrolase family protein [Phycisphaeraceae bacterium]
MLKRESTEWCMFYWYNTEDTTLPRVLMIGDSIVVGCHGEAAEQLKGKATLAYFSTSKCAGDPAYYRELALSMAGYRFAAIHVNNGLHGFDISDADYALGVASLLDNLQELAPEAKLIWAASTPITVKSDPATLEPAKNPRVLERNRLTRQIMDQRGIAVNDLYGLVADHPEYSAGDGYHYNALGNQVLGRHVAKVIAGMLG